MKIRLFLLPWLLALPGVAQESVPPLPMEELEPFPPPAAAVTGEVKSGTGVVPGVKLEPEDKVGRTFAKDNPFIVWGGTRSQRANLFTAAGLVRRDVLESLRLPDTWANHIVIQLREPLAAGTESRPPVWTSIHQVEGGFRIEINLVPRRHSVPGPLLRENLVRAILADQVLSGKDHLNLAGAPTPPPDWLLHGTLALMDYRESGRMSVTFSRIFHLGRVLSVADILNADPVGMDSLSLTIYRVSCGGLLMMLTEQAKGGEQLAKLLPALAHGGTDHADLISRYYPSLGDSANSLSKWWSLQIASLSQPGMEEIRKPGETEQLLAEALILRFTQPPAEEKKPGTLKRLFSREKPAEPVGRAATPAPAPPPPSLETCGIADYARVLALPDSAPVFNQASLSLTKLLLRAHPVYRPIIAEYQEILRGLAKGKPGKNLPATLARLATTRERLAATVQGIEDHLDWYEATQTTIPTGEFEDYLRTADELEKPPAPRGDAISRYLDEVEKEVDR